MNRWFLAIIIWDCLGVGINLAKDGEPRESKYSFILSAIVSFIEIGLIYMAIKTGF